MQYEQARIYTDAFDIMCGECQEHEYTVWEKVSEEELHELHDYLVIEDKHLPEFQKKIMEEEGYYESVETDFNEWLEHSIRDGYIRRVA